MKYAIVTGGARGLGMGIVKALLADQVVEHVAIVDRELAPPPAEVNVTVTSETSATPSLTPPAPAEEPAPEEPKDQPKEDPNVSEAMAKLDEARAAFAKGDYAKAQELIEKGDLSLGHAKALMGLDSPEAIARLAQRAATTGMSVRQTEQAVTNLIHPPPKPGIIGKPVDPNVSDAALDI